MRQTRDHKLDTRTISKKRTTFATTDRDTVIVESEPIDSLIISSIKHNNQSLNKKQTLLFYILNNPKKKKSKLKIDLSKTYFFF